MKIKNLDISSLKSLLSTLSLPSTITVDSTIGIVSLVALLTPLEETFQKSGNSILESYKIEIGPSGASWKDHEKSEEISKKWTQLCNKEIDVPVNFTEENLYVKIGSGLRVDQLVFLQKFLAN
jgi:hypothetical protein